MSKKIICPLEGKGAEVGKIKKVDRKEMAIMLLLLILKRSSMKVITDNISIEIRDHPRDKEWILHLQNHHNQNTKVPPTK